MKIKLMSKKEAIRYSAIEHKETSVVISISCDGKTRLLSNNNIKDVLYLMFQDITKEQANKYDLECMSEQDGEMIKRFVNKWKDKVDSIIIHCHAGISRSSAVAIGVSRYLGYDDMWVWKGDYSPNSHVLDIVNKVLNLRMSKDNIKELYEIAYINRVRN